MDKSTIGVLLIAGGIILGLSGVGGWGWLIFISLFFFDETN